MNEFLICSAIAPFPNCIGSHDVWWRLFLVNVYAALLVEESEQMQMVKTTRLNKSKLIRYYLNPISLFL